MNREPPRRIDKPEPCYLAVRLVKGGPRCAARIWNVLGHLCGEVNGISCSPDDLWTSGERITAAAYFALRDNPPAEPNKKIDVRALTTF